jgi:hypothetical protein
MLLLKPLVTLLGWIDSVVRVSLNVKKGENSAKSFAIPIKRSIRILIFKALNKADIS